MQQSRRTNPYPWTWEIPLLGGITILLILVLSLHMARAIANLCAGGGVQFTPRTELFSSLPQLVSGNAGAGLNPPSGARADSNHLWCWIAVTELLVVVAMSPIVRWGLRWWGPGRIQGMASPGEASQLLGIARIRRNATLIRPDLYGNDKTS